MNFAHDDLKIVIVKRPYDSYRESQEVRDLLSKVFKLKLDGYTKYYPYGILPISDLDFIGDHILICKGERGNLVPISGFKFIRYSDCQTFRVPFPIFNHKFGQEIDKFSDYVEGIKCWMESLKQMGHDFGYTASWTMDPSLDKNLRNLIREMTYFLICTYPESENIFSVINSAAALHGVNIHKEKMGMQYLKAPSGEKLGAFDAPTFFGQPFYIMHTLPTGFSQSFRDECLKYKTMWENRIVIEKKIIESEKVA
jgi:hypothetical protein